MKCKHSVDDKLLSFHDTFISHVTYVLGVDTAALNPHPNLMIYMQSVLRQSKMCYHNQIL